jgi:hypothetical protein
VGTQAALLDAPLLDTGEISSPACLYSVAYVATTAFESHQRAPRSESRRSEVDLQLECPGLKGSAGSTLGSACHANLIHFLRL